MGTTTAVSTSFDDEALEQMLETEAFDILHFHEPWQPFLSRQILLRLSHNVTKLLGDILGRRRVDARRCDIQRAKIVANEAVEFTLVADEDVDRPFQVRRRAKAIIEPDGEVIRSQWDVLADHMIHGPVRDLFRGIEVHVVLYNSCHDLRSKIVRNSAARFFAWERQDAGLP